MEKMRRQVRILGILATIFGIMTLVSGGQALFLGPERGIDMGAVVPQILWFNFLAGFAYVATGVGLWLGRRWAANVALLLAAATLLAFAYLGVHIATGGSYELRTVMAMVLRSAFWVAVGLFARREIH